MLEDSEIEFALGAIEILEKLVKALITRYEKKGSAGFCTLLRSDLSQIRIWLENTRTRADENYFAEILDLLEAICKSTPKAEQPVLGQKPPSIDKHPELSKLVTKRWYRDARTSLERFYPASSGTARDKELRLKNQKRRHEQFESILKRIEAAEAVGVAEPKVTRTDDDDFSDHLSMLYSVLSRYSVYQGSSADIVPKIRLSGYRRYDASGSTFEMLFPDHPHQAGGRPCNWQNAVIHVGPKVSFEDKTADQGPAIGIDYHEFCGAISGQHQEQLFLTVSKRDGKLHQYMPPDTFSSCAWMLTASDTPTLSLRKILADGELLDSSQAHVKIKIILCYLLTKGVWQFYESKLMPSEWTKDTVEFLLEYRERNGTLTAGVFLNQALISADFHSSPPKQQRPCNPSHRFPKIRELGIMLLEILLGREIDSFRGEPEVQPFLPGGRVKPYTDHNIANWLFKKRILQNTSIIKPIKDVIGRCLNDQSLRPLLTKKTGKPGPGLREVMYDQLVMPLESLLQIMYDDPYDLNPLHELNPATPTATYPIESQPRQEPNLNPRRARTLHIPAQDAESQLEEIQQTTQPLSERWFREMGLVQGLLQHASDDERNPQTVKVAILDTGFDQDHGSLPYDIDADNYKDFIGGQDDIRRDNTGHGTALARLILEILEDVDLYVARVLRIEDSVDEGIERVGQAIRWAADNGADIILMAWGTNRVHEGVRKSINSLPDEVLFISAAGNRVDSDKVAFPARMSRVMCIFAATALHTIPQRLNPNPLRPGQGFNFGIFGEAVRPNEAWDAPLSGTSYAAALAAGFAASLLHFSRQPVPSGETALDLQGYDKMNCVFEELSKDNRDREYCCVVPWRLMTLIDKENMSRQEQRRRIRDSLSYTLLQEM